MTELWAVLTAGPYQPENPSGIVAVLSDRHAANEEAKRISAGFDRTWVQGLPALDVPVAGDPGGDWLRATGRA